jgi:RNA polymerase sigma-70 factor (ECF subfamily)
VDRETLDRFRQGDETAVKAVYQRYAGPVFSVALSLLGDPDMAADVTQQTFIKAWRAASTYDPERSLGPWIYAIARRTAIDAHRRRSSRDLPMTTEPATIGEGLETAWEVFEVRLALEQLPEDEREVIRLSHLEGLTHSEIASVLDIPVGTVKSRSHRAHRRLHGLLKHLEEA